MFLITNDRQFGFRALISSMKKKGSVNICGKKLFALVAFCLFILITMVPVAGLVGGGPAEAGDNTSTLLATRGED